MKTVLDWLKALWTWIIGTRSRPYRLITVHGSFPRGLDSKRVYVLLEDSEPWEARMICPCGCGEELDLNLLPDDHPTWSVRSDEGGHVTVRPSICRHVGCRSHFLLRKGIVEWV
jgi:hypothetical protein